MAQQAKKGNSQIKRLLGNKNTVTLLGILICIATLVIGYNYRVSQAISPTTIPYAAQKIPARTYITDKMVDNIRVSQDYINVATNLLTTGDQVIGKKSTYRTAIPAGSLFYKEMILEKDEMPDYAFSNIKDGQTIYPLAVDSESTFNNSVSAGDFIDLYMRVSEASGEGDDVADKGKVIFGKFIESIQVLAVKDSAGRNIVKHGADYGNPSELLFAVDEEYYLLLKWAELLNIDIIPVLHNQKYSIGKDDSSTSVNSDYLRNYITDQVIDIGDN